MIGEMRNRVAIQSLTNSTDSGGGQAITYSTAVTVWAKVENLSGSETMFGDQIEGRSTYKFTIRYYSALNTSYRLSYNSKVFNIQHIKSVLEGKETYQIIDAREGVAT